MTVPEPTYITADEVAEQTLIAALQDLEPGNITKLIQVAEGQIDRFCGRQPHHPYDSNLDRVFPRAQDFSVTVFSGSRLEFPETPAIPLAVSVACLRQVEWLFLQWWPTSATTQPKAGSVAVEQESIGGDGSYSATYANPTDLSRASLCAESQAELENGYRSRWAPLATTDVRTSPLARGA